jgi:eukaryotic-like serine/threonine-protein kinase
MKLDNELREKLANGLIEAFPTPSSLEQMLSYRLDKSLKVIAGEGSLQDIVFRLIETSNSEGWIANLICEACNHNPGNLKLYSIVQNQNLIIKNSSTLYNIIEESLKEHKYSELDELGSGATGVTYRASRGNDQKLIVIKTIKNDLLYRKIKSANQEFKELDDAITNFKNEAEILSNFKHRHIVSYYDHLTIKYKLLINNPDKKPDNKPYLVRQLNLLFLIMEYIEGETLEELLSRRNTPLENKEALGYIQQIGEALTLVHNKGVLHRDIKPQNIMVCNTTNDAVLIDFGIAREFNSKVTQTHTVAFTQGYAPPEQLEQRSKRGNYTDVYGLAATLYYLLTKDHPPHAFERKSDSSSFIEPKKINSNISDTVNEVILWGMELESSKRPQTVQQWLAKLLLLSTAIQLKPTQEVTVTTEKNVVETQSPLSVPQYDSEDDLSISRERPVIVPPTLSAEPSSVLTTLECIDYTQLNDLLKNQEWIKADKETYTLMLELVDLKREASFNCKDIDKLSSEYLWTINNFWKDFSRGSFGFSVQKEIYEREGKDFNKFAEKVGWKREKWLFYPELTSEEVPNGYFPASWLLESTLKSRKAARRGEWRTLLFSSLIKKLSDCGVC